MWVGEGDFYRLCCHRLTGRFTNHKGREKKARTLDWRLEATERKEVGIERSESFSLFFFFALLFLQ